MTKLLYIAGYGRSGSTILDIILSNHPEIVGVGEVTFLLEDWATDNRFCSCGARYPECKFWKGLFEIFPHDRQLARLVRKLEKLPYLARILSGSIDNRERQAYRHYHDHLFSYIASRTGKSIIVDSSKSARFAVGRPLALAKLVEQDLYVLHLVRNGLDTVESVLVTGSNWAMEGHTQIPKWMGIRSSIGWVKANVLGLVIGRILGPHRYMLLRYEDMLEDPVEAIQKMSQFLGFDPDPLVERIKGDEYFKVGHLVGGNRVRFQGVIKLKKGNRQQSGRHLKPHQRLVFSLIGGWLHHYFGYR